MVFLQKYCKAGLLKLNCALESPGKLVSMQILTRVCSSAQDFAFRSSSQVLLLRKLVRGPHLEHQGLSTMLGSWQARNKYSFNE